MVNSNQEFSVLLNAGFNYFNMKQYSAYTSTFSVELNALNNQLSIIFNSTFN